MGELNVFGAVLDNMIERQLVEQANKEDYKGDDGLLYCGRCRTPKQYLVKNWYDGTDKVVPVRCKCSAEKEKAKENQALREKLIARSQIEKKYLANRFDSLEVDNNNRRAIKISRMYVERFQDHYKESQGLLFYGPVGTGKSVLAHCIATELIDRLHSTASISLAKILSSGFVNLEEETRIMSLVNNVQLLIVDDLGAERSNDYAQQFVYSVLDTRCNSGKPMIITTNLSLDDMQNCSDIKFRRIYDRILDVCFPIELAGVSRRMRNAAKRYQNLPKREDKIVTTIPQREFALLSSLYIRCPFWF